MNRLRSILFALAIGLTGLGKAAFAATAVSVGDVSLPKAAVPAGEGAGASFSDQASSTQASSAASGSPAPSQSPADPPVVGSWTAKDIALVLAQLVGASIGGLAAWISIQNTKRTVNAAVETATAQRWREANEAEILSLEGVLREFHNPFLVLSSANNNFAQDLGARIGGDGYRLLLCLFDPDWFPGLAPADQTLVSEICSTALVLRAFIEAHAGLVSAELANHLARASSHFLVLNLVYNGKLGRDGSAFERYSYPRELDIALLADRERIENRLALLRSDPARDHGLLKAFVLPEDAVLPEWPSAVQSMPAT